MTVWLILLGACAGLLLWWARNRTKARPPLEQEPQRQPSPPKPPNQGDRSHTIDGSPQAQPGTVAPTPSQATTPIGDGSEPDRDEWDQDALDGYFAGKLKRLPGLRLRLQYRDVKERVTVREVTTESFTSNPDIGEAGIGTLKAFCHLRQANRFFRFNRISDVVDLETGELVTSLSRWLQDRYSSTPQSAVDHFMAAHGAALQCLFAMGKADGALRKAERQVLFAFAARHGIAGEAMDQLLDTAKNNFGGTKHEFWAAAKALKEHVGDPDYLPTLLRALDDMMRCSAGVQREEELLLAYAARAWDLPLPARQS